MRFAAAAAAGLLLLCGQSFAREVDFYVLSLSWSPSYCAAEGAQAEPAQCASARPYAFVVHGLWPQHGKGYPQFCDPSPEWVPQKLVDSMLDLMPSKGLIVHQWKKHGTCSGLSAADYFAMVRKVRTKIQIPPAYVNPKSWGTASPAAVEADFRKANPGLNADAIAVTCDHRHLREVRICLSRDLDFQSCPDINRRACSRRELAIPPVR